MAGANEVFLLSRWGVLTVVIEGEKIFDKADEGGHPELNRIKELKAIVKDRVSAAMATA